MKVERVITEGLRRARPEQNYELTDGHPTYAREQQNGEARLRSGRKWRNEPKEPDVKREEDKGLSRQRRQSSILEELSRQASVLWGDELPSDAEDAGTTDDESHEEALEMG